MDYSKATTTQLETIFNHEYDLPNHLLVGLVTEMMNRNLFEGMIITVAKGLFHTYDREEIKQLAHIGIYQMAKKFKPGNLSLKRLVFIVIERRLKSLIQHNHTIRNQLNQSALGYEMPIMVDGANVEKIVIDKLFFQEQLEKLTEKERYIITEFLKGYSLNHLAKRFKKDAKYLHYHFQKALKKMNIEDYKIGNRGAMKGA